MSTAVKSHFKTLGLYNFKRGFGWAYKGWGGGLYPGGLISGIKKMFGNNEISERRIKAYIPLHFELVRYIYNTFIVRHKATCLSVTFN